VAKYEMVILRQQWRAQKEFEEQAVELQRDLGTATPARHLWVRVRLLEVLVEQTGGNTLTDNFRLILSDLKKAVSLRAVASRCARSSSNLHVVRAS
jgi:hypothetical protein